MPEQEATETRPSVVERLRDMTFACPGCGYALRGITSATCPECGRSVTHEDLDAAARPPLWTRLGPAALLAVAWTLLPAVLGLTLFIEFREEAAEWLQSHELMLALGIYMGVFTLSAGLGLLPTWAQAVIGGYAFGVAWGFAGALAGFVGASVVGYFVARTIAKNRVEREIESNPRATAMRDALVGKGGWRTLLHVFLVRFPPNSPFALTNGLMATTEVPFGAYLLGTTLGMAPRTFAGVWIGSKVQDWDDIGMPSWMKYGGIALMFVVVMVLGHIAQKAAEKVTGVGNASAPDQADGGDADAGDGSGADTGAKTGEPHSGQV